MAFFDKVGSWPVGACRPGLGWVGECPGICEFGFQALGVKVLRQVWCKGFVYGAPVNPSPQTVNSQHQQSNWLRL